MDDQQRDGMYNTLQEQVTRLQNEIAEIKRRLAELEARGKGTVTIRGMDSAR